MTVRVCVRVSTALVSAIVGDTDPRAAEWRQAPKPLVVPALSFALAFALNATAMTTFGGGCGGGSVRISGEVGVSKKEGCTDTSES